MEWQNWAGNVTATPQQIAHPGNEAELAGLIQKTAYAGRPVRVVGSGHSFQPLCATDGLLLSLDGLQGVIAADSSTGRATVWAGTKLHALGEPLRAAGLALENMGDIDRQSVAGATATGTHGTGPTLGNLSSQVVGLRLVTAAGQTLDINGTDQPALFSAAQVSLGSLGVITQATLRCLPVYRLHERTWAEPFADCMARLDERIAATRHFEFFWVPGEDVAACKALQPVESESGQASENPPALSERLRRYIGPERVDWSYRIFPSERNNRFVEMEFAVPAADGPACMHEIRALMQEHHPAVQWPVEYRTLAADNSWLSPAYRRHSVTISVHQAADLPYADFFADAETIFRRYRGRPHWGKLHSHTAADFAALYPRWDDFQAVRQELDPKGRFLNDYLRRVFGLI
ncbi:MAG: D-arabinono-1,4-lactone oxidase [Caldilineaceae bacterium]